MPSEMKDGDTEELKIYRSLIVHTTTKKHPPVSTGGGSPLLFCHVLLQQLALLKSRACELEWESSFPSCSTKPVRGVNPDTHQGPYATPVEPLLLLRLPQSSSGISIKWYYKATLIRCWGIFSQTRVGIWGKLSWIIEKYSLYDVPYYW